MGRKKTTGLLYPVCTQLRLSVEHDAELVRLAEQVHMPKSALARVLLECVLDNQLRQVQEAAGAAYDRWHPLTPVSGHASRGGG